MSTASGRNRPGSLTLRQFVESLRRWTPEMRQVAQIALTRTEAERRSYLQGFHARHHEREPRRSTPSCAGPTPTRDWTTCRP